MCANVPKTLTQTEYYIPDTLSSLLTLQGSRIAEISSLDSLRSLLKSSSLNPFKLVGLRPDQSESFEEKERKSPLGLTVR